MEVLRLEGVRKTFGTLPVLDDVTFSVQKGTIYGFIGKNGAGKTTTMKLILGLIQADGGRISVCGEPVVFGGTKTNRRLGYLPDVPAFYDYMKPSEYLSLCGEISGMAAGDIRKRSGELLELVGLTGAERRISGFSRGMKQRLGIAQALLAEPELLICDEPTSALDPIGRQEVLDILQEVKKQTTVLFSTHILSDVERICDHVGVLDGGKLILDGDIAKLKARSRAGLIQLICKHQAADDAAFAEELTRLANVVSVKQQSGGFLLQLRREEDEELLLSQLMEKKLRILKYEVVEPTLEHLFMEVVT